MQVLQAATRKFGGLLVALNQRALNFTLVAKGVSCE